MNILDRYEQIANLREKRECKNNINKDIFRALFPAISRLVLQYEKLTKVDCQTAKAARDNTEEKEKIIDILSEYISKYGKFN